MPPAGGTFEALAVYNPVITADVQRVPSLIEVEGSKFVSQTIKRHEFATLKLRSLPPRAALVQRFANALKTAQTEEKMHGWIRGQTS